MELDEIVHHIFGRDIDTSGICDTDPSSSSPPPSKNSKCLKCVHHLVEKVMEEMDLLHNKQVLPLDTREGRVGHATACFDVTSHVGLFVIGADQLTIYSQSNFSTIRANACVYRGKWQYEVQLGSAGVMQIGWATIDCKFSQETGVGDTVNSYAYDGNRVRKWNVSTQKYGETWLSGDIIGCTIDLDSGVIEFYRNGRHMGEAFDSIRLGPGMAYFPAVSLAFTENLVANFGSTPLRYPVPGFEPIQKAPFHDVVKAEQLCKWLLQLLMLFDRKYEMLGQPDVPQSDEPISNQALLMGLARIFLHPLAPLLLSPFITEACLVPFLENLCHLSSDCRHFKNKTPSGKKRRLMLFLDMMWAFLEVHELKKCLESVVICLLAGFRCVSNVLDYPHQKQSLLLLTFLVQHPQTRRHLLQNILFDKFRFANFIHVKPLDEGSLAEIVKHVWWDTSGLDQKVEENKAAYFTACQKIREAIAGVETLQVELLKTLLDNSDGTATQASSRAIFLHKFSNFLHEDILSNRTLPLLQTHLPLTLCCLHRLLVTFRALWDREVGEYPIVVPARTFYDGSVNYYNLDRLGGVLSHLNKTLKPQLVKVLGPDHPVITTIESSGIEPQDVGSDTNAALISHPLMSMASQPSSGYANFISPPLAHMLIQQQPSSGPVLVRKVSVGLFREEKAKNGPLDAAASLIKLLDMLVLFYHAAAHKQLVKASSVHDSMAEYSTVLGRITEQLETYKHPPPNVPLETNSADIIDELERSCGIFKQKLSEQACHMAWIRAAVYSADKQSHLAWLIRVILQTMKLASKEGHLFAYMPDYYLDSLVEICTALRTYVHPTAPIENIEGYEGLLVEVAEFLCEHFSDPRIVHANSKDTLIQALASFVYSPNTLLSLERVPYASRMNMVRALLRPYENRAWAQSNWVLVRIWQGCGFAFRYHKSPHLVRKLGPKLLQADFSLISQSIKPCPSHVFQDHVKEVMLSDEAQSTAFLNSLLNQLNWAFSEFIGMLQEIQNVSGRRERVFIESRQLKICATCFDLALALLRALEMVVSIAPEIFTDATRHSSEPLLARLCQLLCQILNRISSQAGCFQHVVMLNIPDLETVDHFPILTAVVGIVLAVLHDDIQKFDVSVSKVPEVTKALLTEPSFQLESINFVLGDMQKGSKLKKMKPFSFCNYSEDVSVTEIEDVKKMIQLLTFYQERLSDVTVLSDDELCTICYAYPISATFRPCNHQSCRACIGHHLMNSKDCFFCKATIQFVIGLGDEVLHDLSTLENSAT